LNDLSSSSYSEEQSGLELSTEQALCCVLGRCFPCLKNVL
jgi:hypothetical protein